MSLYLIGSFLHCNSCLTLVMESGSKIYYQILECFTFKTKLFLFHLENRQSECQWCFWSFDWFCKYIVHLISTIPEQNVLGGPTLPSKKQGDLGKKSLEMFEFFIPEIAAMHPILKTSSYLWGSHPLLLFSLNLSKIVGGGCPSPQPLPKLRHCLMYCT